MLSAGPPSVVGVELASTAWDSDFYDYLESAGLGTDGYAIPVGSSLQAKTLSWTNLDQIVLRFNEDVNIDAADLSLSGVNTTSYIFSSFHYDPQTYTAKWTLNSPISMDRLRIDLDADGMDPVRDLDGNILDGEWTNNASTFESGNGTSGGDFEFTFNVLPADVNNSASVTYYDYLYVRSLDGKSTTDAGYVAARDLDGSGLIDSDDWEIALDHILDQLPTGSPAGTSNDAPTTGGLGLTAVNNAAVDVAISLFSAFDDAENSGNGLTYSIVSNSNSSLFDYVYINPTSGQMIVNAASGVSGRAVVKVRATDANGLGVDSNSTIDVNYTNQAPTIINYSCNYVGAYTWVFSGYVIDPDDELSQFLVQFYGIFEKRASVDETGYFEIAVFLDSGVAGYEYCVTHDPHGLQSNIPVSFIGLT